MRNYLFSLILLPVLIVTVLLNGCKKSTNPVPASSTAKVFYRKINYKLTIYNELWSVNADGTNDHKINIVLPVGWALVAYDMAAVSNDGKTIVVSVYNSSLSERGFYKCNIDGSDAQKILTMPDQPGLKWDLEGFINQSSILYSDGTYLWSVSLDGTNNMKINVDLPAGSVLGYEEFTKITSDGKTIVFVAFNNHAGAIYKCNADGSNLARVVAGSSNQTGLYIQDIVNDQTILYQEPVYNKVSDNSGWEVQKFWSVDINGNNKQQINISLPTATVLKLTEMARAFDNGRSMFFLANSTLTSADGIYLLYASNIDGSQPKIVKRFSEGEQISIQFVVNQQ